MNTRYRCTACGNLTRFDVTITRRTRDYHHYSVGGDLNVEDVEVLSEKVEEVLCRWCGSGGSVIEEEAPDGELDTVSPEPVDTTQAASTAD